MFHLNIVDILPVLLYATPNDDWSVLEVLTVWTRRRDPADKSMIIH